MDTTGMNTGWGHWLRLKDKVRVGLQRCRTNCALNCGYCPYCLIKEKYGTEECSSVLANDAEVLIDQLLGNHIHVMGLYETDPDFIKDIKEELEEVCER